MGGQRAGAVLGRDAALCNSKVIEKRMMVKEKEIITNAYECTKFHECAVALWLRTSQLRLKGRPTYVPVP